MTKKFVVFVEGMTLPATEADVHLVAGWPVLFVEDAVGDDPVAIGEETLYRAREAGAQVAAVATYSPRYSAADPDRPWAGQSAFVFVSDELAKTLWDEVRGVEAWSAGMGPQLPLPLAPPPDVLTEE